jgi:hypothetical protein
MWRVREMRCAMIEALRSHFLEALGSHLGFHTLIISLFLRIVIESVVLIL